MARTWLSLTVELVEGAGYRFWPRPARVFAAGRKHTFGQLATAIDVSFGRWDRSHLWQFELAGHVYVAPDDPEWDSAGGSQLLSAQTRLSRLAIGDVFVYQFDPADAWLHLCRVAESRIDPLEELGESPDEPMPYDGWGILPDQYLRRFAEDDGETPVPRDLRNRDLPPLRPWWGPQAADVAPAAPDAEQAGDGASGGQLDAPLEQP
jgi:hypothetical protein